MAKSKDGEPLRFEGAPHRLVGRVPLHGGLTGEALASVPPKISLGSRVAAAGFLPPRIRAADPSVAVLKLRLPRSTPPGTYEGAAELGGRSVPVVADVQPLHCLRATPSSASLQGVTPGKPVPLEISLVNLGNVAADIQPRHTFCVFDGSGVDRAFYVALAEDPPEGSRRVDRLMDELATYHGGLVRLDVVDGAGPLRPGEQRALRFELRFSERMRPGRAYAGTWLLENLRFAVRAETAPETGARKEAR
jgi:hypothetical protein